MSDNMKIWKCEECKKRAGKTVSEPCYANHDIQCTYGPDWQPAPELCIIPPFEPLTTDILMPSEKQAIINAAEKTIKNHNIGYVGILKTIKGIGPVSNLGWSIESFIQLAKQHHKSISLPDVFGKIVNDTASQVHQQGNEARNTTAPTDNTKKPPRRRVKIIWSEVTKENVHIAASLNGYTDEDIIKHDDTIIGELGGPRVRVSDIPETWLEDVPEPGPVNLKGAKDNFLKLNRLQEHFGSNTPTSPSLIFEVIADHFWFACEEHQKLRHLPQQSKSAMFNDLPVDQRYTPAYDHFNRGWQACLKSHNLPDS